MLASIGVYLVALIPSECRPCVPTTWKASVGRKHAAFIAVGFAVLYVGALYMAETDTGLGEIFRR